MQKELLRGKIAEKGLSGAKLAAEMGLNIKTYYKKFNAADFKIGECQFLAQRLEISEPSEIARIFFT